MASSASLTIRPASAGDAEDLYRLSVAAIQDSTGEHYSPAERDAWCSRRSVAGHAWMIENTVVFVADDAGETAGFASFALTPVGDLAAGEVDQLYVHPAHGGKGAARMLLETVEAAAATAGLHELVTHASWRAAPVFEAAGYRREAVESVVINDQTLTRALMRKHLAEPPGQ